MAIEFWTELECPVREQLGVPVFKDMLRQRMVAQGLFDRDVARGMTKGQALAGSFRWAIVSTDGTRRFCDLHVGVVLEQTKLLDVLVDRCTDCPAAMGAGYGCYNVINFPISAKGEAWLAEVARRAGERRDAANMPIRVIFDNRLTGGQFARMRRELGERAFGLRAPLDVSFGSGPFKRKTATTDQVLDILFLAGDLSGPFLEMLSLFSGGMTVSEKEPREGTFQMASSMTDEKGHVTWLAFDLPDGEEDDITIRQFKRFFRAVFRAYQLDRPMTVDV